MKKNVYLFPITSFIILLLLAFQSGYSQPGTLNGNVKDINGNPLTGASITVQGKKTGTTTDLNGNYSLKLPAGQYTIIASFVGQVAQSSVVTISSGSTTEQNFKIGETLDLIAVVATGSRSRQARTKLNTPVPVDILPISEISKDVAQVDLSQLLSYTAPSFQSARQAISDGTDHLDPAQLRGLGSDQVLVLINGKRRHQSALVNVNGTVNRGQVGTDFGAIPISAIEKIEILRDGAAAQYGSDAIAGVINIILKKSTNFLNGSVSFGQHITQYKKDYAFEKLRNTSVEDKKVYDGQNFHAGLNYGFSIGKNGFINLTGEYAVRDKTNRTGTYTGQVFSNVNGVNKDDSILNARSLTRNDFDMRIGNSRIVSGSFMVNAGIALNDSWKLKFTAEYNQKNGEAAGFFRYPSSITSGAATFANQALTLYPNGFLPLIKTDIKDFFFSIGVDGKLGNWNASLYNTIGANNFDFSVDHSVNYTQFEVTANPQTKFDAGGLRFLQNTINADLSRSFSVLYGLNVAYGAEFRIDQYAQRAGEEASYKNYNINSAAIAGAQVFPGFVPAYANRHSRNNLGLYIDLEQEFTKEWLLELALRFENYSDFGSTLNYKAATRYKLGDHFMLRAAASTGFRAPSLQQKFYAKTNTIFVSTPNGLVPNEIGTFPNDSKPAEILGIPALKEETSDNYSFGFVTTPINGFELSIDGYLINIKDRIVLTNNFGGGNNTALTQELKDNGASLANFFTNAIDTRAKGIDAILSYHTSFAKSNKLKLTLAATFIENEVKKGPDGKPIIKASEILVNSGQLGSYFNREDQSRIEVASPSSKGSFIINYSHKKLGAMIRFAYFGKVVYIDPTINPSNPDAFPVNAFTGQKETLDQEFSPKTVTDVSVSYELTKNLAFTLGSNNIFDVYQDEHVHSGNVSLGRFIYSRRVEQMGFNGRYVFARIAFNVK